MRSFLPLLAVFLLACSDNASNALATRPAHSDAPDASRGGAAGLAPTQPPGTQQPQGPSLPVCTSAPLRNSPVRLNHVATLGPLGSLVPPDHVFPTPHMYFYVRNDATPNDIEVPVYAPADIWITSIGLRHYGQLGGKIDYTDYTLTFAICVGLEMYYHHVRAFTHPALIEALRVNVCRPAGLGNETFCAFPVNVRIAAGDAMATTGDRVAGVGGLDMGARDYRLVTGRSAFANPDRWCGGGPQRNIFDHCYAVCPLDYLTPADRAPLLERFSDSTRAYTRTEEPRCGTAYQDRPGSAQGRWLKPGAPAQGEGSHLHLGPNPFTSALEEFSMGTSVSGVTGGAYLFSPLPVGAVNRRFAEIVDERVYCFEQLGRGLVTGAAAPPRAAFTIVIQLRSGATRLAVEQRGQVTCGPGPWDLTGAAAVFER